MQSPVMEGKQQQQQKNLKQAIRNQRLPLFLIQFGAIFPKLWDLPVALPLNLTP